MRKKQAGGLFYFARFPRRPHPLARLRRNGQHRLLVFAVCVCDELSMATDRTVSNASRAGTDTAREDVVIRGNDDVRRCNALNNPTASSVRWFIDFHPMSAP